jgi:hypothetical protein
MLDCWFLAIAGSLMSIYPPPDITLWLRDYGRYTISYRFDGSRIHRWSRLCRACAFLICSRPGNPDIHYLFKCNPTIFLLSADFTT